MKKNLLLLIVVLGFAARVYNVSSVPPSLNWDEVSHGYNAYSILTTGKDEWGVSFPTIFRAFGDYKLPVYIYLTAISELIFGLSAFAVRFPSVLAGTISIYLTYLLAKKITKKENAALFAALIMAVSPWSLFLSRVAVEANVSLALIIGGIYLFVDGLEKKKSSIFLGAMLLSLSAWTYNSARIFVPLMLFSIMVIYWSDAKNLFRTKTKLALLSAGVLLLFLVPMFVQLLNSEGSARYENVQILDEGAIAEINDRRQKANMPAIVERFFYNKAIFFAEKFTTNYLNHYSPNFLFLKGGDNYQFNVPNHGLFYILNLPFLVYGAFKFWKNRSDKRIQLVLAWLVLSPVAASITRESPHTLRSIMLMTPIIIIISWGIYETFRVINKSYVLPLYLLALCFSFASYYKFYLVDYSKMYSFAWQYGYSQMASIVEEKYDDYEKIVITKKHGEPHIFMLFYLKVYPATYREDPNLVRFNQSNWFWVDRFDKFYFVNDWDIPETSSKFKLESGGEFDCASCILFTGEGNAPEGWRKIDEILFLNGEVAFDIYEH